MEFLKKEYLDRTLGESWKGTERLLVRIQDILQGEGIQVYRISSEPPDRKLSEIRDLYLSFHLHLPWKSKDVEVVLPWPFWYRPERASAAFILGGKVWKWYPRILNREFRLTTPEHWYDLQIRRWINWTKKAKFPKANFTHLLLKECRLLTVNDSHLEWAEDKIRWGYEMRENRDVWPEYLGRIDPVATTEGNRVGFNLALALDARVVDDHLCAPTDQGYLPPKEAPALRLESGGWVGKEGLGREERADLPQLRGRIVSLTLSTTPFLEYNDLNRLTMAYAQMRSAVPNLVEGPERPRILTKEADEFGLWAGKELRIAYTNYGGLTYEDAIVVSQSAAQRFRIWWWQDITFPIWKGRKIVLEDWIKEGVGISPGEVLGRIHQNLPPHPLQEALGIHPKDHSQSYPIHYDLPLPGVVERIELSAEEVQMTIRLEIPLTLGDKIVGRYGNKGVVAQIVPDEEMPQTEEGPIEIIISPAAVIGRMNLGQIYEVYLSMLLSRIQEPKDLEKLRRWVPFLVWNEDLGRAEALYENFSRSLHPESLQEALEYLGYPRHGLRKVYFPKENVWRETLWGYAYFFRTHHIAFLRMAGIDLARRHFDYPYRGKKLKGGQRVGEMEIRGLLSHQARGILSELPYRCDGDYLSWRKALFLSGGEPDLRNLHPKIRRSMRYLQDTLRALGIEMEIVEESDA